ncbi:MAG: precorrin-2 C(20)-methyltransferase [Eubacteriales bacterium]|nr:precorrin-2 C(20)-methyltransferase [Eubacteriales bacterium]
MNGILYGVGVGPGDPELMTLKAVRMIEENHIIALPGAVPTETIAYQIAIQAVPALAEKQLIPIYMPMTHNQEELERNHQKGAQIIESHLKQGNNVIFLTLGDPSIYSTFTYIQQVVEQHGYSTAMVSGITSFCAAAASVNIPLVKWNEQLHIIPAVHSLKHQLPDSGNYVLMKSGRKMKQVKELLAASKRDIVTVENCGTEKEHIYRGVDEIPDDAGYYSLIIAKEPCCDD